MVRHVPYNLILGKAMFPLYDKFEVRHHKISFAGTIFMLIDRGETLI